MIAEPPGLPFALHSPQAVWREGNFILGVNNEQ